MPSQNERGHARNLEALSRLIAAVQTLDPTRYDPPNADLEIASLQAQHADGAAVAGSLSDRRAGWRTKAKDRAFDVDKLPARAARAVALFASTDADKEKVAQARTYLRKLQGKRAKTKPADDPATPGDESEAAISASQQSSAQMLNHFLGLVDFLEAQSEYAALNVPELRTADLRSFATPIQAKHDDSITAAAEVSAALIERDRVYYDNPDSIIKRAARVKEYVKAVFGANSPEYKMVNDINFRKP